MMSALLRLQSPTPAINRETTVKPAGTLTSHPSQAKFIRLPRRKFTVTSFQTTENVGSTTSSEPSISPQFTSSVASPSLQLTISPRHITVLNVAACAVAISATWLFFCAIPTLLAFKRAAESLEKLLDVTREELPDTMAAVRLSGMEISDLTMELSDLGQEITQGVKSSTNAVRMAEEKLRSFANMTSRAPMQGLITQVTTKTTATEPVIATTVRGIRERIVKGRGMLNMVFALSRFSKLFSSYFAKRSGSKMLNN